MGCVTSKILPDNYPEKPPAEKSPNILRGDITRKDEAKMLREKKILERQNKRTAAAEEMSGKVMEERELLSLGTRSRATSRATSRAGSPSITARKQVTFKSDIDAENASSSTLRSDKGSKNGKTKQINKVSPNGSIKISENNNQTKMDSNAVFQPINIQITDPVNQSNSLKSESNTSTVVKNSKNNSNVQDEDHLETKQDKLSVIEERTSSRCSGKSETETKRG